MNTDAGFEESAAPAPQRRIELRLAGKARARPDARSEWHELPRKAAALLALLIVDGPIARERAASLLWPDVGGDKPRANLRGLLRDMRRIVGSDLVLASDPLEPAPGIVHDLTAEAAPNSAPRSDALLLDAHDFSDLEAFSEWLHQARERIKSQRKRGWFDAAETFAERDELPQAIVLAERLVTFDLLDETSHRLLMRLLYEQGDAAAAAAAFARCRAALAQAHDGAEPSQPTRLLATLIDTGQALPAAAHRPEAGSQRWPLLARETECRAIETAWRKGQAVLLEGESGIGKSSLLARFKGDDRRRLLVESKRGDAEVTYALMARLLKTLLENRGCPVEESHADELARLLPELGKMPPYPAHTTRLIEALAAALQAWHDNGLELLLIDDLHWADTASVNLLLAAQARVQGLRWLFAVRPRLHPAALTAQREERPEKWCLVQPTPLDATAVEALLRSLPWAISHPSEWASLLAARALGNPLQIVETLRAASELQGGRLLRSAPPAADALPVPQTLPALAQARLSRLSGRTLQLAQLAALAGPVFSVKLAVQVLQTSELDLGTDWSTLIEHRILDDEGLAHDAFRDPLIELLPQPVARELHARVAQVASGLGAVAAELAPHWLQARDWPQAASALEQAAKVAFAQNARSDELRLCDLAAECREKMGDQAHAFANRVQAFDAALEVLPGEAAIARVELLQRAARGKSQQLDGLIAAALIEFNRVRFEQALGHAGQAIELARGLSLEQPESVEPRWLRAQFLQCYALSGLGRIDDALKVAEPLRPRVEVSGDKRLLLDLCDVIGHVCGLASRWADSFAAYTRSSELAEQLGNLGEAAISTANLALNLQQQGRLQQACALARKAEAWRQRIGAKDGVTDLRLQRLLGTLEHRLGRFEPAIQALQSALHLARQQQSPLLAASGENALARVYVDLGDPTKARSVLTPWPSATSDAGRIGRLLVELDIEKIEGGDPAPSMDDMARAWSNEPPSTQWASELSLIRILRPGDSVQRCQRIASLAEQAGAGGIELSAMLVLADALRERGDFPAAVERLQAALQRLPECRPSTLYFGEMWWIAYRVFEAAGLDDEARQALESGRRWVLDEALPQVPQEFKRSFLEGNVVNRWLLAGG